MKPEPGTSRPRLLVNAGANWLGFAAQIAVAFYLSPILARGLGQERYGLWALVESILAYLTLLDLGIAASLVRYTARFDTTGDRDSLNRTFSASLMLFAAAGLVALLVAAGITAGGLWLPAPWSADGSPALHAAEGYRADVSWVLLILGLNMAVGLPMNVFPSLLDGLGRYPAKTAIRTAGLLLRVPLCLWLVDAEHGLVRLALIQLGCNVLEHVAIAVAAWRYLPGLRFTWKVDRATLKSIGGYSRDAFLAMLAGRIAFQTDALVIGWFLPPQCIAFFSVAARLVEQPKNSIRALTAVLTPAMSAWEAKGDETAIRRAFLDSTRWVLWLVLPIQAGLYLLGAQFLTLWMGPDYAAASYATLAILALPLSLAMAQSVTSRVLYGMGKLRWFVRIVMAEALVNLLLSVLLVGPLGIEGVAWGTTVPDLVGTVVLAIYVCRVLKIGAGDYVVRAWLGPLTVTLVPAAVWLLGAAWVGLDDWPSLLGVGASGVGAYAVVAALVEFGPKRLAGLIRRFVPFGRRAAASPVPAEAA